MSVEWLEPWWPTDGMGDDFHAGFQRQLQKELCAEHELFGIDVRLIARGNGDDALFELLDGTGRFAAVHLTWSSQRQQLPWPDTSIYESIEDFAENCMKRDYYDFGFA